MLNNCRDRAWQGRESNLYRCNANTPYEACEPTKGVNRQAGSIPIGAATSCFDARGLQSLVNVQRRSH
jgi:hypothetical protein